MTYIIPSASVPASSSPNSVSGASLRRSNDRIVSHLLSYMSSAETSSENGIPISSASADSFAVFFSCISLFSACRTSQSRLLESLAASRISFRFSTSFTFDRAFRSEMVICRSPPVFSLTMPGSSLAMFLLLRIVVRERPVAFATSATFMPKSSRHICIPAASSAIDSPLRCMFSTSIVSTCSCSDISAMTHSSSVSPAFFAARSLQFPATTRYFPSFFGSGTTTRFWSTPFSLMLAVSSFKSP